MSLGEVIPLVGESGDAYTVIVRGHVGVEAFQEAYAGELGREAEADAIQHSWGRWIPIPASRRHAEYPIVRWLHPADPHARGAFPYTEHTRDLP